MYLPLVFGLRKKHIVAPTNFLISLDVQYCFMFVPFDRAAPGPLIMEGSPA